MPEKSVREMNKYERLRYSLASRTFHTAVGGAMILGIVGNLRVDPKRLFTADDKA